ncbi:MAG: transporter substrate-binding domain-containing protein [Bermanella sp.]
MGSSNSYLTTILILLTLTSIARASQAEELTLLIDDYPPYIDKSQENQGFWSEMVILAFERVGIQARLLYKPWGRVEREIDGANQVSFGWVKDSKRLKNWYFSKTISTGTAGFLSKKSSDISWLTYEDLRQYKIGKTIGYSFGDEFKKWEPMLNIQRVPEDRQNIQKVLIGRIDLFVTEIASAAMLIREHLTEAEKNSLGFITSPALPAWTAHLVCSKEYEKCPYYINKFNQGLKVLTQQGIKQKIIKQINSLK